MHYMIFFSVWAYLYFSVENNVRNGSLILNSKCQKRFLILGHLNQHKVKKKYQISKKEIIPVNNDNLYFQKTGSYQLNL